MGHVQTKQIKRAQVKRQKGEEYLHCTKSIRRQRVKDKIKWKKIR
jgi:hypothetical protein